MDIFHYFQRKPRILITGGAGFIGGAVIRKLLKDSDCTIINLDKMSYASDLTSINKELLNLGLKNTERYQFINVDLKNSVDTSNAVNFADPDLVMHLAAESHVDKSIQNPEDFITSNIIGTYNLLEAS